PPQRPRGADPEQDAGGGGAGGVRPGGGALRGAAGDARRGSGRRPGPGPALVHRLVTGVAVPVARVAAHGHRDVVSTAPARGAAPRTPATSGPVVPAGDQAKDVQLDEEAARAPEPATADETLS